MDKIQSVFFNENQLIEYLKKYGPKISSEFLPTDITEISTAIWTKRLFETEKNKRFLIAFELKGKLEELMPTFNANSPEDVKELFNKHVKKDTVIDFAIAIEENLGKKNRNKIGFAFQLKVISQTHKDFEKNLVEAINQNLLKKYPKLSQDISLLIIPQLKSNIYLEEPLDLKSIRKNIKPQKDSFEKIFILWTKKPYRNLTEIYPNLVNFRLEI